MTSSFEMHYLEDATLQFERQKRLVDRAVAQIDDDDFFATLDGEANSIAVLIKHMAGNLRSRWTDFLIADGEKADRDRDGEFIIEPGDTRALLMERWDAGWSALFTAFDGLDEGNIHGTIRIRGEELSIVQAINRQMSHYGYHVGQIVLLAKHFAGDEWQTLSIARGQSRQYNREGGRWLPKGDDGA